MDELELYGPKLGGPITDRCCKKMDIIVIDASDINDYWYGIECFNCGWVYFKGYSCSDKALKVRGYLNKKFNLKD